MRSRTLLLLVGIVAILGAVAYLLYRQGYFARDSENGAEIARLGEKTLDISPVAGANTGWPQWRGPTRDGRASEQQWRTDWDKNPPKRLWSSPCGGGYSSCTVVAGKLYTQDRQGEDERILCLNADDGKPLWEYRYQAPQAGKDRNYASGPRATPSVIGSRVYAVGGAGKCLCLEAPTQPNGQPTVRWQHDLLSEFGADMPQWGVACSPLVTNGLVIVQPGGKKGSVVAFDAESGDKRWASGSVAGAYSSPVTATISGIPTIFAFTEKSLLAVRQDGTITDTYLWPTHPEVNAATPLVVDDYVFISSGYNTGCALLRAEKRGDDVKLVEVYARRGVRGFRNHHASSVYRDRYLYGFDDSQLKCVAFDTGAVKADWSADGVGKGNLILAGKFLIIQTERGELCLVEAVAEEFRLIAKIPKVLSGNNNWATPTLVDGRLYLRDEQKVVCYDVRP